MIRPYFQKLTVDSKGVGLSFVYDKVAVKHPEVNAILPQKTFFMSIMFGKHIVQLGWYYEVNVRLNRKMRRKLTRKIRKNPYK